jgi:RNA polymerase sigma-70 factor (ECF subfamily)
MTACATCELRTPQATESALAGFFKALSALLGSETEPETADEAALQRLIDQARSGDRNAGQRLYRQHVNRVYRTMRGILRSDADAEDVTQDAMLTVLTSLDRYSPRSGIRFSAWVMVIAMNTLRRRFRRLRPELTATGELPDIADGTEGIEHQIDVARRRRALLEALAELADRERMLVSLRYGAELNAKEIGALTGIGAANVRKILERTRERLGARLEALLQTHEELR